MKNDIICREIATEELPQLLACAREFAAQVNDLPLDEFHWMNMWQAFLATESGVIFAAEKDGRFIGMIGMIKYPCLVSGRTVGVECFWFTRPGHRGIGVKLYNMAEQWCRDNGCVRMAMIYLPESMPDKLETFYTRKGYRLRELHFEKSLEDSV